MWGLWCLVWVNVNLTGCIRMVPRYTKNGEGSISSSLRNDIHSTLHQVLYTQTRHAAEVKERSHGCGSRPSITCPRPPEGENMNTAQVTPVPVHIQSTYGSVRSEAHTLTMCVVWLEVRIDCPIRQDMAAYLNNPRVDHLAFRRGNLSWSVASLDAPLLASAQDREEGRTLSLAASTCN
ncbi:hypothetical protein LZ30DRAFT_797673 [Colletotrichum cereale]|nr:hypothetical protein LZ30DRAFT_797673 [Colletotrichum cereale]